MLLEEIMSGKRERGVLEKMGPEGMLYAGASKGWIGPWRPEYAIAVGEMRGRAALEARENRYGRIH